MHKTPSGEQKKALKRKAKELAREARIVQKAARITPIVEGKARRLQAKAEAALADAGALELQARLEDLRIWKMRKVRATRNGTRTYTYWMASWREGAKVRNIHLGSCQKVSHEVALEKARTLKAEALGI